MVVIRTTSAKGKRGKTVSFKKADRRNAVDLKANQTASYISNVSRYIYTVKSFIPLADLQFYDLH